MAKNRSLPADATRASAIIAACLVFAGCTNPARESIDITDWCWLHYRLAPPGALASDSGPDSAADAVAWDTWLGVTADAPADRRDAHEMQRRLIDRFVDSGRWTDSERERYRTIAQIGPTPATICETVGARIAVGDDGAVPDGWDERFLEPDDSAYSELAVAGLDR